MVSHVNVVIVIVAFLYYYTDVYHTLRISLYNTRKTIRQGLPVRAQLPLTRTCLLLMWYRLRYVYVTLTKITVLLLFCNPKKLDENILHIFLLPIEEQSSIHCDTFA